MAYHDPYPQRPAPDHFVRRWLFITACVAALMLFWQFLPAIEAWFSPRQAAERTVTPRGDLAADEKATIELFPQNAKELMVNGWFCGRFGAIELHIKCQSCEWARLEDDLHIAACWELPFNIKDKRVRLDVIFGVFLACWLLVLVHYILQFVAHLCYF